jgi:hypothetical protein
MSTIAPPSFGQRSGLGNRPSRALTTSLATYTTRSGERREILRLTGAGDTSLVIDRDCDGANNARLLAHLATDEPVDNARRISDMYLADTGTRPCRSLTSEDLQRAFGEGASSANALANGREDDEGASLATALADRHGVSYRLEVCADRGSISQLRWCRLAAQHGQRPKPVSVRHVIGALESYEPARVLTLAALARYADDDSVSVVALRGELERVSLSPIVLNRGLREAVEQALAGGEVTMSEIAIRCGRLRRGERGAVSGETSWLGRRIGLVAEAGHSQPTPWIHSDVLALIARDGLGLCPRDVEV